MSIYENGPGDAAAEAAPAPSGGMTMAESLTASGGGTKLGVRGGLEGVLAKLKALPPAHKAAAAAVCVLLVVVVALLASTGDPTVRRTDANFFDYLLDLETCQIHFTFGAIRSSASRT